MAITKDQLISDLAEAIDLQKNDVRALLEQLQGQTTRRAAMVSTLVAVRSPHDPEPLVATGRVAGLHVQVRDAVPAGALLVELEIDP